MSKKMSRSISKKNEKGKLIFKFIEESKCPKCGAGIESYRHYKWNKWGETISFTCGFCIESETPLWVKEYGICKNSKEWKKLKKKREKELEVVRLFVEKNVSSKNLKKEFLNKIKSIEYGIERMWEDE